MRRINIESPYAGDVEENVKYARRCMEKVIDRGDSPIASHLLYPQCLDDQNPEDRSLGIKCGFEWTHVAHQSILFVDRGISGGMRIGEMEAQKWFIPLAYERLDPLPQPFFIRISGRRSVGKDTLAECIQKLIPNSAIMGFADTLKQEYANILIQRCSVLPLPTAETYRDILLTDQFTNIDEETEKAIYHKLKTDYAFKEKHRQGLIDLGKSEKDTFGKDIWVTRLVRKASSLESKNVIIVPDTRYNYEFENPVFTKLNSITIRVRATNKTREARGWKFNPTVDMNESETGLDAETRFDIFIDNDSTAEALGKEASRLVQRYSLAPFVI